ncbi:LOG family protein [Acetobacter peroxydans]|uniref:Cytokinin riboside 5'-monophosphate phosphoribohydrolase n=1 Tax=Acetobacter peroxydans TaxID=104098 RepID=A0A4Y3TRD5_9PROT|nr:TIGR00730 family Rossman fold protein [Acetobacter peroxydans]NHO16833.1 TIGR00730 family Rossman fold protein [Acetobacter peroxydans]GBR38348.1 lysine decarboxylase [Acetobacter peroxydans NBRC 13755]GBR39890.1 lysine decarboxylase [Acetobacter peroxydans]GEB85591.1 cytokinin riboside 5'-monophosphate phosphoribohydrolase [Acetobacter peroxydans]
MSSIARTIAVFCGSRLGNDPIYQNVAEQAGAVLAREGIRLVYGGGANGLMGVVADSVIRAGGEVTGVIPEFLTVREKMHECVSELIVTASMHERKQIMFARAEAFWILPGGFGTFDEMMEILTWRQLERHDKPIILVNTANWGEAVVAMLETAVRQGFASEQARALLQVVPDVETALACSVWQERSAPVPVDTL